MKYKSFLASILLVVIIELGLICLIKLKESRDIIILWKAEKTEQSIRQVNEVMLEAAKSRSYDICKRIDDKKKLKECYDKVSMVKAIDKRNVDLCKRVENKIARNVCVDNVIIAKAIKLKNPSLCEKMYDKLRIPLCKKKALSNNRNMFDNK